jgi:glycosyltransferase involved in cell wall biosynthesis
MRSPSLTDLPQAPTGRAGWPWTEEGPSLPARRPDGSVWPRVSIVTPAYNQADYLEETIRSVLLQSYPDLEYIIVNDGSTDNTVDVIHKYEPWLAFWTTQRNQGQCAAINHGFEHVTGHIQAYLNSDDLLLPGALQKAALEIDPVRRRHVVMGRSAFTDQHGRYTGIEHPSHFESHRRVLEVWRGHTIPQPSVFWTPEVWQTCGPMIEDLGPAWVDYGLFCRFSKRYTFNFVDQVLSTYRLHLESKTQRSSEAKRLEESIQISRRYWGSPVSLMYWQLTFSLARYRFNRVGRARRLHWSAQELRRQNHGAWAFSRDLVAGLLAPEVVFGIAIYPTVSKHARGGLKRALDWLDSKRDSYSQTEAYMGFTDVWEDGWVGPRLVTSQETTNESCQLLIRGKAELQYLKKPLILNFRVDGQEIGNRQVDQSSEFRIELSLPAPLRPDRHQIEVQTNAWFVPHRLTRNGDYRPLAWRKIEIQLA